MRQGVAAGPADPIVRAVRAGLGPVAVAGPAHRDAPRGELADPGMVRYQQILHRRRDQGRRPPGIRHRPGVVQRQQAAGRVIAGCQIGHLGSEYGAGRGREACEIADHGAMPGLADGNVLPGATADRDVFDARLEGGWAVRGGVAPVGQHGLGENVLGVGAVGGEGPADAAIMADHQERHAGRGRANQRARWRVDPRQIPNARRAVSKVRIAR
jgi:hypothetical protein